jgi:hypothetical protein
MLNIAYAPGDAKLAEEMKKDLVSSGLTLVHDYLLVLVSGSTFEDAGVLQTVKEAERRSQRVVPVLVERVALPPEMTAGDSLDFSRGYRKDRLVSFLKWADIGKAKIIVNRRIMAFLLVVITLMFLAAITGILGGLVAFPQDEYETQSAIEYATIDAMIMPTLEGYMPRTTEDARYFPQTLEAAPTRLRTFMALTGTAIPLEAQASLSALETSAAQTMTALAVGTSNPSLTVTTTPNG